MKVIRPLLVTQAACDLTGHAADLDHHYRNVQRVPDALEGQHPIRLWEYAMTLRAIYAWKATLVPSARMYAPEIADVGGASSNFWKVLRAQVTRTPISCIDPAYTANEVNAATEQGWREVLAMSVAAALGNPNLRQRFDVVTCISVLEHVPPAHLNGFLTDLTLLLRPGGLLCLTCDYAPPDANDYSSGRVDDRFHFHWMREQIFTAVSFKTQVVDTLTRLGYNSLGHGDLDWLGPQVYDYSMLAAAYVWQPAQPAQPSRDPAPAPVEEPEL